MKFFNENSSVIEIYSEEVKGRKVALYDYVDLDTDQVNRVKIWEIKTENFDVLKDIWLHEIRQLLRIQNYPKAGIYLELLKNATYDENGFYIFYNNAESTRILSDYIKDVVNQNSSDIRKISLKKHWLHSLSLRKLENRIIFWKNILRIAKAIQILHTQGIIHRNININSIVYNNEALSTSETFKLTGFEWSLYLNQLNYKEFSSLKEDLFPSATFKSDWISLGLLIVQLLNLNMDEIENSYLLVKEKALIKLLVDDTNINDIYDNKINLEKVENKISLIIKDLSGFYHDNTKDKPLILILNINEEGKLLTFIKNFIDSKYGLDLNLDEKVDYIKQDLNLKNIIMYKCLRGKSIFYLLVGKKLVYQVAEFIESGNDKTSSTADYLFIQKIFEGIPSFAGNSKIEFSAKIDVEILNNFSKRKNQLVNFKSWSSIIELFNEKEIYTKEFLDLLQGLLFIYAIEVGLYKANLFQVSANIFYRKDLESHDCEFLSIVLLDDKNNKNLSKNLKIEHYSERFKKMVEDSKENKWIIRKNRKNNILDELAKPIEIIFHSIDYKNKCYIFKTKKSYDLTNNISKNMTLMTSSSEGSKAAFRRKNKALQKLMDQHLLTNSIVDPVGTYRKIKYGYEYHESFEKLDEAKKEVFTNILETEPNFIVQGPPGVGKSFLITTLIRQIFKEESFSKILLTAQSHSTVNVLYNLVSKIEFKDDPIIIDAFDNKNIDAINDDKKIIERVTDKYVREFENSQMFEDIQKHYSNNLTEQLNAFIREGGQRLSFFEQILRSANMLFTTSNSKIIEDLIQNNVQFDYTILEEAGKSSGLELISPLMLSHKRLLVGDHKQLPPFLENTIERIVNSNDVNFGHIINEVKDGEFRFSLFNQLNLSAFSTNEGEAKDSDFNDNIRNLIKNVGQFFSLFKFLAVKAQELNDRGQESFGQIINQQHRMHPDIGNVVSKAIYDAKLLNHISTEENYLNLSHQPYKFKSSQKLDLSHSTKGVLWVDIPFKNNTENLEGDFDVGYINEQEVNVIEYILTLLERNYECSEINDDNLSIQILSPYSKQAEYISNRLTLNSIPNGFKLKNTDRICKTVDSFQGNEADIIIVSLVKHNSNGYIESSLGFLLDQRRMNVLLSRAKYKLIIVGSFGMFSGWAKQLPNYESKIEKKINNDPNYEDKQFIKLFTNILSEHPPAYCDFVSADKYFSEVK